MSLAILTMLRLRSSMDRKERRKVTMRGLRSSMDSKDR
jgi:hypothetical protein